MQYLDTKYFISLQNWIVNKKLSSCSYEEICLLYNEKFQADDNLNNDDIKTCLKRSWQNTSSIRCGYRHAKSLYPGFYNMK